MKNTTNRTDQKPTTNTPSSTERNNFVGGNLSGAQVNFAPSAKNCQVIIGVGCRLEGLQINLYAENLLVDIGNNNVIRGEIHMKISSAKVIIGNNNRIRNHVFMNVGSDISIGNDCLFASVKFRSTDSHKIFELKTKERINSNKPISIQNRVWLAEDVMLLGGSSVGNDSVVGARSLVTSEIPQNSLAVGSPAKIVKSGIYWEE